MRGTEAIEDTGSYMKGTELHGVPAMLSAMLIASSWNPIKQQRPATSSSTANGAHNCRGCHLSSAGPGQYGCPCGQGSVSCPSFGWNGPCLSWHPAS